jgi:hypothetical protein
MYNTETVTFFVLWASLKSRAGTTPLHNIQIQKIVTTTTTTNNNNNASIAHNPQLTTCPDQADSQSKTIKITQEVGQRRKYSQHIS